MYPKFIDKFTSQNLNDEVESRIPIEYCKAVYTNLARMLGNAKR